MSIFVYLRHVIMRPHTVVGKENMYNALVNFIEQNEVYTASESDDAHMRQRNRSSLFHITDWCMFGAKPLPRPDNTNSFLRDNRLEIMMC